VEPHHRFLLANQLAHIDFLGEQVDRISGEIGQRIEAMSQSPQVGNGAPASDEGLDEETPDHQGASLTWAEAVTLLDSIPGVDQRTAEVMLAEMGLDMSQFPTAKHLTSWAGLAPGNNQSGGKRYSARTRKGNRPLSTIMVQAAWSAVRTKETFLKARYHRLAARRGKKRAIVAIARSMLASTWHILTHRQPYQELGGDYFDQRKKEAKVSYLTRQLEKLTGGAVHIELHTAAA